MGPRLPLAVRAAAPTGIGGSPYVYRLAPAAIARLGYAARPWRGPGYVGHTLDAVEAVCALVRRNHPENDPAVLRWLPESIVVDVLGSGGSDATA